MHKLRFRQVHLDFHTSPFIPGIGSKFDKKEWQETLLEACVDSITCFASCHHGWSYHPTKVGKMHPGLDFDLLRAQVDACHEVGINAPIYLTGGVNNLASSEHPEWREISCRGQYMGWSKEPLHPGFHKMCFNTPYLDYLCDMLKESTGLFPDADGVFIDIIHQGHCCCPACMRDMLKEGYDPENEQDRAAFARKVLMNYYRRTVEAIHSVKPDMPVFHNSGTIRLGDTEVLPYFSHLELESLPTGGWGYDHYPVTAAYCRKLNTDFLGMTGKFHTTWGEFGGFKHPNALRYECAAMLAQGSKCSIGDQLHPCGQLDKSTYRLIGAAYKEVAEKEPWCNNVKNTAKIAVLGAEAVSRGTRRDMPGDTGAARLLLELHQPFDFLDTEMNFDDYSIIILPDEVRVDETLEAKLKTYLARGGKLILSGCSGMKPESDVFCFDIGADGGSLSKFSPDYILCGEDFAPEEISTPFVMYASSRRIKVRPGVQSLGEVYDPYFNRSYKHFSSHQHTPYRPESSGYDAGSMTGNILYFAHPLFSLYRAYGATVLKSFFGKALAKFAGNGLQVITDMPSQGRLTLMDQPEHDRSICHLLYVNTILRGGICSVSGGNADTTTAMEIIEELNPSPEINVSLALERPVKSMFLVPQKTPLEFVQKNGRVDFTVKSFRCHQMIEINY